MAERLDISGMRRMLAAPILVLGLFTLSACTPAPVADVATVNGSPAASSSDLDAETAIRHYAQCMRDHGLDLPDPVGDVAFPPRGPHEPGWDVADAACRHLLPGGGVDEVFDAQVLEQLRQFAVCMRAHDIEVSDPELPGAGTHPGNMVIGGRLAGATRDGLANDPGYQSALAACRDKLPADTKKDPNS